MKGLLLGVFIKEEVPSLNIVNTTGKFRCQLYPALRLGHLLALLPRVGLEPRHLALLQPELPLPGELLAVLAPRLLLAPEGLFGLPEDAPQLLLQILREPELRQLRAGGRGRGGAGGGQQPQCEQRQHGGRAPAPQPGHSCGQERVRGASTNNKTGGDV